MKPTNIRLQDIVARTARVQLRDTIRVLRSLAIVAEKVYEDRQLAGSLNALLLDSAKTGNFPAPLHSKPDALAVDACYEAYDMVEGSVGTQQLDLMIALDSDPYFDARVKEMGQSPVSVEEFEDNKGNL